MALTQAQVQVIINTNVTTNGQNRNTGAGLDAALTALNQAVFQGNVTLLTPSGSDDAPALNSALAAGSNILWSPGPFNYLSPITATVPANKNLTILGSGPEQTILNWPSGSGGISLSLTNLFSTFNIGNFTITTGTTSGGNALSATLANPTNYPANSAPSFFSNVICRGADGFTLNDWWNVGVDIKKVSNVSYQNVSVYGSQAILGSGIRIDGASTSYSVVHNLKTFYGYGLQVGLFYGNANGYVQGVTVSDGSNFTGCQSCIVAPSSIVGLSELGISNTQFNYSLYGVVTYSAIDFLSIGPGSLFLAQSNSAYAAALIRAQTFSILGAKASAAGLSGNTGFYVGTQVSQGGSMIGNALQYMNVGIVLDTPSSNIVVAMNEYNNNNTNVINSGTNNSVGTASPGAMAGVVP